MVRFWRTCIARPPSPPAGQGGRIPRNECARLRARISKIFGEGESRISGYRSISAESICGSQAVAFRFLSRRVSVKRKQSMRARGRLVVELTARLRLPGNGLRGDHSTLPPRRHGARVAVQIRGLRVTQPSATPASTGIHGGVKSVFDNQKNQRVLRATSARHSCKSESMHAHTLPRGWHTLSLGCSQVYTPTDWVPKTEIRL